MKKSLRYMLSACACATAFIATSNAAIADISEKDFKLVTKAVGFMKSAPSGAVDVAIVYDPAIAGSQTDAEGLKSILGGGLTDKGVTYNPVMVPVSDLSAVSSASVVYVASGMSAHYGAIGDAVKSAKVLSVSSDKACVEAGSCSMFVSSSPKVEIVLNSAAASAAGVEFQSAFKMMVSEI